MILLVGCAPAPAVDLAAICERVGTRVKAELGGFAVEEQKGIAEGIWKAQAVNPLAGAVAKEGRSWEASGDGRFQMGTMVIRYKDEATAKVVAKGLTAQGKTLRGTKMLVPFRVVSLRDVVLILFTETPLQEASGLLLEALSADWIERR